MRPLISTQDFFSALASRGFTHLYHANAVETSISYFRVAALLSRHECSSQHLPQSSQWSDGHDRAHGIFADIFLNFSDLHINFKEPNQYGPVLFCLNIDRLKEYVTSNPSTQIHITKIQPHKWTSSNTDREKWRGDLEDLFVHPMGTSTQRYVKGWADIVLSGVGPSGIPIDVCDEIIVDAHPNNPNFFDQVSSAFNSCMHPHGLQVQIKRRMCRISKCGCKSWSSVQGRNNEFKYNSGGWTSEFGRIA